MIDPLFFSLIIALAVSYVICALIDKRYIHSSVNTYSLLGISAVCGFVGFILFIFLNVYFSIDNVKVPVWGVVPTTLIAVWLNYRWLFDSYEKQKKRNT